MSDESVKQFWDHINSDELISRDIRCRDWGALTIFEKDSIAYIYHMAIGVMAENRR